MESAHGSHVRLSLVLSLRDRTPSDDLLMLEDIYARRFDVLNRGLSGYNTDWALPLFTEVRSAIAPCLPLWRPA
jgi:hypothetical protein